MNVLPAAGTTFRDACDALAAAANANACDKTHADYDVTACRTECNGEDYSGGATTTNSYTAAQCDAILLCHKDRTSGTFSSTDCDTACASGGVWDKDEANLATELVTVRTADCDASAAVTAGTTGTTTEYKVTAPVEATMKFPDATTEDDICGTTDAPSLVTAAIVKAAALAAGVEADTVSSGECTAEKTADTTSSRRRLDDVNFDVALEVIFTVEGADEAAAETAATTLKTTAEADAFKTSLTTGDNSIAKQMVALKTDNAYANDELLTFVNTLDDTYEVAVADVTASSAPADDDDDDDSADGSATSNASKCALFTAFVTMLAGVLA
jgi:hypothetical protein